MAPPLTTFVHQIGYSLAILIPLRKTADPDLLGRGCCRIVEADAAEGPHNSSRRESERGVEIQLGEKGQSWEGKSRIC